MLRFKMLVSVVPLVVAAILARVEFFPSARPCIALGAGNLEIGSAPWHADLHVSFTDDPRLATVRIVGSDVAHAVPLTLLAGLGHSILGTINLHILVSLLCGSIPAIIVASIASARTSDNIVRVTLGIVLLIVCLRFWFF